MNLRAQHCLLGGQQIRPGSPHTLLQQCSISFRGVMCQTQSLLAKCWASNIKLYSPLQLLNDSYSKKKKKNSLKCWEARGYFPESADTILVICINSTTGCRHLPSQQSRHRNAAKPLVLILSVVSSCSCIGYLVLQDRRATPLPVSMNY